jgi:hypothetical protein
VKLALFATLRAELAPRTRPRGRHADGGDPGRAACRINAPEIALVVAILPAAAFMARGCGCFECAGAGRSPAQGEFRSFARLVQQSFGPQLVLSAAAGRSATTYPSAASARARRQGSSIDRDVAGSGTCRWRRATPRGLHHGRQILASVVDIGFSNGSRHKSNSPAGASIVGSGRRAATEALIPSFRHTDSARLKVQIVGEAAYESALLALPMRGPHVQEIQNGRHDVRQSHDVIHLARSDPGARRTRPRRTFS